MSEFSYFPIPLSINDELFVLMNDGNTRTCIRKPNLDSLNLWFTDCNHPAQNALVNAQNIVKWKIKNLNLA